MNSREVNALLIGVGAGTLIASIVFLLTRSAREKALSESTAPISEITELAIAIQQAGDAWVAREDSLRACSFSNLHLRIELARISNLKPF